MADLPKNISDREFTKFKALSDGNNAVLTCAVNPLQINLDGGLNYLGEYDNTTSYIVGDVVTFNGSSYVSLANNTGVDPNNNTWQIIAEKGDKGDTGDDAPSNHSGLTLDDGTNPHGTTSADVGLGNVENLDTSTTANITDSTNKRFVTDYEKTVIGNTSGTNTGDQDLSGKLDVGLAVLKSNYTPAHSILVQQSGTGSPESLQVGNNTLVGRLNGGGSEIDDLSVAQVRELLSIENVDNTSDVNKPISDATQLALNSKLESIDIADFETTTELNDRDVANRSRVNHTGTQLSSTISDFASSVRSTLLAGLSSVTASVILATDTVIEAFQKLQAQIELRALISNVLEKDNTTSYTPTEDFHPATKKYVDDNTFSNPISGSGTSGKIAKFNGTSSVTDSIITESLDNINVDGAIESSLNGVTAELSPLKAGTGLILPSIPRAGFRIKTTDPNFTNTILSVRNSAPVNAPKQNSIEVVSAEEYDGPATLNPLVNRLILSASPDEGLISISRLTGNVPSGELKFKNQGVNNDATLILGADSNAFKVGIGQQVSPEITLAIGDSDTGIDVPAVGALSIKTNGITVMRFNANERVGIGTTTPDEKLEVVGKIKATDINFTGLPTSAVGLSSGDVWNDSGTLKIV